MKTVETIPWNKCSCIENRKKVENIKINFSFLFLFLCLQQIRNDREKSCNYLHIISIEDFYSDEKCFTNIRLLQIYYSNIILTISRLFMIKIVRTSKTTKTFWRLLLVLSKLFIFHTIDIIRLLNLQTWQQTKLKLFSTKITTNSNN